MMKDSKGCHMFVFIFLVVGGLNYLFMLFGYGIDSLLSGLILDIIYVLFAVAAVLSIVKHKGCSMCKGKGEMKEEPKMDHDMNM